jgi:hypothetical protein
MQEFVQKITVRRKNRRFQGLHWVISKLVLTPVFSVHFVQ